MIWPTIIVDNFFDNPNKIVEYSKKLKYLKDEKGEWPGERTDTISNIDQNFFNWINYKIIRLIYPMNHFNMSWTAKQYFQKINGNIYEETGWVHSDSPLELTAIIYLSNHNNCGTSLYNKNKFFNSVINTNEKIQMYSTLNFKDNLKYLKQNNELFEKNLTINSKFNRIVLFDSNQFHAADKFKDNKNKDEERLTLITFFMSLTCENIKFPITEMKRDF